jgi:hypothetical protein
MRFGVQTIIAQYSRSARRGVKIPLWDYMSQYALEDSR